jgi:hypothetical protein
MIRNIRFAALLMVFLMLSVLAGQAIGVSFSYLLPRKGWFSHPVPPLSLRNIDLSFGRYLGVGGSVSLYNIRGMGIKDSDDNPIDMSDPLVGPFLSVLGSAVAKVFLPIRDLELQVSGGLFGCYNIDPPLMTGTLDRYLSTDSGGQAYEAVTSTVSSAGHWGWGFVFGGSATYYIKGQFGITVGANYYIGGADLKLSGSYDAYDEDSGLSTLNDEPLPDILKNARLDITGLEILIGVDVRL